MNIFKSESFRNILYYIIIGILSLITVLFLPFIGSSVGLEWVLPTTAAGWVVFIVTKLIISVMNVLIFHCFMLQAKINIKDDNNYQKANEMLGALKKKEVAPRSPGRWNTQQYLTKGTSLFFSSALATVALTQAIFTFDWVSALSYLFSIVMSVIFGLLQMQSAEEYWTTEYYQYAISEQNKEKEVINNDNN